MACDHLSSAGALSPCSRMHLEATTDITVYVNQIGIYRSKDLSEVRLVDVVSYIDDNVDIRKMSHVRISPLLVLDADGFSLLGVTGKCISSFGGGLQKYGLRAQVDVLPLNGHAVPISKVNTGCRLT